MTTDQAVHAMLERVRPMLQADGGDIELLQLEGDVARVRLTGACAGCPSAEMTLTAGVERALRRIRPDLRIETVA